MIDSVMIVQQNHGPFKQQTLSTEINNKIVKVQEKEKEQITETKKKPSSTDAGDSGKTGTGSSSKSEGTGQKIKELLNRVDRKVVIGVGSGAGALLLLIVIIIVVKKRKTSKTKKYRRWDDKVDYGRKFYSSYNHVDNGDKDTDDFEVEVGDNQSASSKLLMEDRK